MPAVVAGYVHRGGGRAWYATHGASVPQSQGLVGGSAGYRLVVIAASAGGLAAITRVLGALPADFPLPIAVVQHVDPQHHSHVADILARRASLHVKLAEIGDRLVTGTIYVAPPDRHLEIQDEDLIALTQGQLVHYVRPSADRLFESAARTGPVIAVVLTGSGTDGTDGAVAVRAGGGTVIAQDEATAAFFGMPGAAIRAGAVDYVLPLAEIAPKLIELASRSRG
jgi:two-component system, chemotaxis family, protein-glutamate methylesterase/glutaminase